MASSMLKVIEKSSQHGAKLGTQIALRRKKCDVANALKKQLGNKLEKFMQELRAGTGKMLWVPLKVHRTRHYLTP